MSGPPPPQRVPADRDGAVALAAALSSQVAATITRAATFSDAEVRTGVGGEWSTVQSLRHIVLVVDLWLSKMILGIDDPFHPMALPPHFVGPTIPGPSIDPDADPPLAEAAAVVEERLARVRSYVAGVDAAELARDIGTHARTVAGGLGVLFDELAAHDFFVNRDLDSIEQART